MTALIQKLSWQIISTAAFKKEIDSAYIKLNNYNRILKDHLDSLGRDIIYKGSSFILF
jgi:hypothetical protein